MSVLDYEPTVNDLRITVNGQPFGAGAWSPGEIDYQVGRLKEELDQLATRMKRESPKQHKAIFLYGLSNANRT